MTRQEIINTIAGEELKVAYAIAVLKLAGEVLAEFVDDKPHTPERDKLAGLEGTMNMLHDYLEQTWNNLGDVDRALILGKDLDRVA